MEIWGTLRESEQRCDTPTCQCSQCPGHLTYNKPWKSLTKFILPWKSLSSVVLGNHYLKLAPNILRRSLLFPSVCEPLVLPLLDVSPGSPLSWCEPWKASIYVHICEPYLPDLNVSPPWYEPCTSPAWMWALDFFPYLDVSPGPPRCEAHYY